MLFYTLTITDLSGNVTKTEKMNHITAMQAINQLLINYGFNKPITKDTFHNILSRPNVLPERLRWLFNNGKLVFEPTNEPKPKSKPTN